MEGQASPPEDALIGANDETNLPFPDLSIFGQASRQYVTAIFTLESKLVLGRAQAMKSKYFWAPLWASGTLAGVMAG